MGKAYQSRSWAVLIYCHDEGASENQNWHWLFLFSPLLFDCNHCGVYRCHIHNRHTRIRSNLLRLENNSNKKCASPRTCHIRVSEKIAKAGILPMLPRAIEDWHKVKIFEKWSTVFGFMSHVSFKTQLACQTTKAWCDKVMMIWELVLQMIWFLYGLKKTAEMDL